MRRILLFTLALFVGCGDPDLATPSFCNPLGGAACLMPWPSAVYEKDDPTTETHVRVDLPASAMPKNIDHAAVDADIYNSHDGYSYAAPMMIAFPTGVDPSNLVNNRNIAASLTAESPTVVIDLSTGELVAHFAEVDAAAEAKPASQALYIRPAKLLKPATHYAVAIKNTLKAKDGGALPIPEGFRAILDDTKTSHARLERVRSHYPDIFAALEAHGIQRGDLVVAWDFTTRSRTQVQSDLRYARAAALPMMGTDGSALAYTITSDTVPSDTRIARQITGTFDAPLFLSSDPGTAEDTTLRRDAQGHPQPNGFYRVPFTAIIPQCALQGSAQVPIILYGHGLMGASDQVTNGGMRAASAEICAVGVGTDMRGMSEVDVTNVVHTLNDVNQGRLIFDVLVQGMMNHIAMVQIARGPMAKDLFVRNNGTSLVDPSKVYYYGISQGGIMGTTVCAIDPVIKRCVVQVGAINYSTLLERSADWPEYRIVLTGAYEDPLLVAFMINLMQQEWDRTEPVAVADVITGEGFPETGPKQVFMQIGIADDQVPNVGSELQARTMGIPVITPTPYTPYGLAEATTAQSGLVIYDFGLGATIPLTNTPPPKNDVHGSLRNKQATTDMMKHFYETGEITNMCTAPKGCDCTVAGACGAAI